ncbi:MAG: hypothetical protein ACK421_04220 [Pseudanabaenaceae cyanobacterium]
MGGQGYKRRKESGRYKRNNSFSPFWSDFFTDAGVFDPFFMATIYPRADEQPKQEGNNTLAVGTTNSNQLTAKTPTTDKQPVTIGVLDDPQKYQPLAE